MSTTCRVIAAALVVISAGCGSGGDRTASTLGAQGADTWGGVVDRKVLGRRQPSVRVSDDGTFRVLDPIAWDWKGQQRLPHHVDWSLAPRLTQPDTSGLLTFRVSGTQAPITARVKVFDTVDSETGVPALEPRVDVTCPAAKQRCRLRREQGAIVFDVLVPREAADRPGYAVVSLRWAFIPRFPASGGISTEDNIWSVAAPFRV